MTTDHNEPRLAGYQLSKEEALAFAQEKRWAPMTPIERGLFQLRQDRLCMDFSAFHEGITALLGRSVWTHEFASPDDLWAEYLGKTPAPDFAAILAKLPDPSKAIIIHTGEA